VLGPKLGSAHKNEASDHTTDAILVSGFPAEHNNMLMMCLAPRSVFVQQALCVGIPGGVCAWFSIE